MFGVRRWKVGFEMKRLTLGIAIGTLVVLALLLVLRTPLGNGWHRFGLIPLSDLEKFELLQRALASTENLETESADRDWEVLYQHLPMDASVALNRALNRTLHLEQAIETAEVALAGGAPLDASAADRTRAVATARQAIEQYQALSHDPVTAAWLASRVDLLEAATLAETEAARAIREQVLERLAQQIDSMSDEPQGIRILAGPWLQAWEEIEASDVETTAAFQERSATTLSELSDRAPDNLYLALRAAKLGVAARSFQSDAPVVRTRELARAIEPTLRPLTEAIGLTPDELAQSIVDAIEERNWALASSQLNLWFNLLNGTDQVKTDRRRIQPHPLDRLSFVTLRELSAKLVKERPAAIGKAPLKFEHWAGGKVPDMVTAATIDIDLDLQPEVISVTSAGRLELWQAAANDPTEWRSVAQLDVGMPATGLLVADLFMVDASDPRRLQILARGEDDAHASASRHSTIPSLLVYGPEGIRLVAVDGRAGVPPEERLSLPDGETGLENVDQVITAAAGDLEGDGDLDLIISTRNHGLRLFINRGNRTFFELESIGPDDPASPLRNVSAIAIVDVDRDLDLDLMVVDGESGRVGWVENLLHLQFRVRELPELPAVRGANRIRVGDFDGNVSWDLLYGGPARVGLVHTQTPEAGRWEIETADEIEHGGTDFLVADWDNDSWQEMLVTSPRGALWQRLLGGTASEPIACELDPVRRLLEAVDFDADGRLDLLVAVEGGWAIRRNTTDPVGHHLGARFRGIDDNHPASGRINHYAVGSVLELRFGPHYRAEVISSPTTHFGLDGFEQASTLRAIFPNGLTQTIRNPPIDSIIEEEQTLKGSCPYLYAWDGEQYSFVTDCLWAAPLGLQVAQNVVAQDRPWEYLKVDGDLVRPRGDHYELRITEELWEIAYIDHVALTAVDHPADVEVWTHEKVGPAEIAGPELHAFLDSDVLPLYAAIDPAGEDVTHLLRDVDGNHYKGFRQRLRQGLCPPHWVDLDFGPWPDGRTENRVLLVLTGWILPTDSSLNIQIDQNPDLEKIEFPSVWVPDSEAPDGWKLAIPYMGFPGGKSKTIVVDVSDVIRRDDPRLRVRTSAEIYWDAAALVVQTRRPEIVTHELKLTAAELVYRGFSEKHRRSETSPEWYDYSQVSREPRWPPLGGKFSIFGDCLPLVRQWDDRMVVMGPGDELRLTFRTPLAAPPTGWKRDFVLHCVGWDKDADLNTLAGQSSEPLPFRSMRSYPPPPDQAEQLRRVEGLNAEQLRRRQSFRHFWSR